MKAWLKMFFQGIVMGVADLIPGVSGGTVAFITGLHPKLLLSLKTLKISSIKNPKQIAWFTLSAVFMGMLLMIALGSHAIFFLLNDTLYHALLRSLFMGLMLGSTFFCLRQVKQWSAVHYFALIIGVVIAFSISFLCHRQSTEPLYDIPLEIEAPSHVLGEAANYDYHKKLLKNVNWANLHSLYRDSFIDSETWIFSHDKDAYLQVESCLQRHFNFPYFLKMGACGALSIGAMILPGISGNQIMQLMGCYDSIIQAIANWTSGVFSQSFINHSFWVLFSLGIGILFGVATFSRVIVFFYQKYFSATLAALVGFMVGSLPSLWPFWQVSYHIHLLKDRYQLNLQRLKPVFPTLASYQTGLALAMVISGILIVFWLERKSTLNKLQYIES